MGATYVNLYYLMPRWLYSRKYLIYTGLLAIDILIFTAILGLSLYVFLNFVAPHALPEFFTPQTFVESIGASTLGTTILTFGLKQGKRQLDTERKNQLLEKENLQTELKFLRSQFNPHFLFNGLNNIYFLIKKDPDLAADSLAIFSDILRYQLYECNESKIPIQQEVQFLKNYIEFAQLRKNRVLVDANWSNQLNGQQIAPLLLLPMVENAFKHVSKWKEKENQIHFNLVIHQQTLIFESSNTFDPNTKSNDKLGGIGIENLKRRLALLYPNKHQLKINQNAEQYAIQLNLDLKESPNLFAHELPDH